MITKGNFKELLVNLGFSNKGDTFSKKFRETDAYLKANFNSEKLIYPIEKGLVISGQQTSNFSQNENFVVFECVHRLFEKVTIPAVLSLNRLIVKSKRMMVVAEPTLY